MLRIFICLGLFLTLPMVAQAEMDAQNLLEEVRKDIRARNSAAQHVRFSFDMKLSSVGDEFFMAKLHFDPSQETKQQWQVRFPSKAENEEIYTKTHQQIAEGRKNNPKIQEDRDLIIEEFLGKGELNPVFSRTHNGIAIFEFSVPSSFLGDENEDDGMGDFTKYLSGELGIDLSNRQLAWMHIYAKKPFKPVMMAKVKHFDLRLDIAPAWPNGPMVQVREQIVISGTAMFQKFSQNIETIHSNFRKK